MRRTVQWLAAATIAAGAGTPIAAGAQPAPIVGSSWYAFTFAFPGGDPPGAPVFRYFSDPVAGTGGPSVLDGFRLTIGSGFTGRLRVTDLGLSGDRFNVFLNGASAPAFTTDAPTDGEGFDFDPASAFLSGDFSTGLSAVLNPGTYIITLGLNSQTPTVAGSDGEGALQAVITQDPTTPPDGSVVPEPATVVLTASGLAALALVARRRRAAAR